MLFVTGGVVAASERRKKPWHFSGSRLHRSGSGFWKSVVTMTTVGYGEKASMTIAGRIVVWLWRFIAVVTVSGSRARMAASCTP